MSTNRTTIYLSADVLSAARLLNFNISEICQQALRDAIDAKKRELQAAIDAAEAAHQLFAALESDGVLAE